MRIMMRCVVLAFLLAGSGCMNEEVAETAQGICNCNVPPPEPCCCQTPIVLDLEGDGIELTSWEDGVEFALVPARGKEWRAWTTPGTDDAFLFVDLTDDRVVTNGIELFGNVTDQPKPPAGQSRNGFLALAQHDSNGDGLIDAKDSIFAELRLWRDINHDGVSTFDEVSDLNAHGIVGLSVVYDEPRKPDGHGNLFRFSAAVVTAPGSKVSKTSWDVSLTSPTPAERRARGIPAPIPPPSEPPPDDKPTQARIRHPLLACDLDLHTTLANNGGSVVSSSWYSVVSGTCPLATIWSTSQIYHWRFGAWTRMAINQVSNTTPGHTIAASHPCRFPVRGSWRSRASFNWDNVWDDDGLPEVVWSSQRDYTQCNESPTSDTPPPCLGDELP